MSEDGPGRIVIARLPRWRNYHGTVKLNDVSSGRFVGLPTSDWKQPAPDWTAADFAAAITAVQNLLIAAPAHVLSVGATWSHARLLETRDGTLLDATAAGGAMALAPADVAGGGTGLALVAGGTRIQALSQWLESRQWMLRTSGSHGAPSLAGALATGTHGARLGRRGIEEHVRGLLLVTGPASCAWVAPEHGPRLSAALLSAIAPQARLFADDGLFAAALSHLGGLGHVAALLVEAEPLRFFLPVKRALRLWPGWQRQWADGEQAQMAVRVWRDLGGATEERPELMSCEVNLDPWELDAGIGCFSLRFDGGSPRSRLVAPAAEQPTVATLSQAIGDAASFAPLMSLPQAFEIEFNLSQTRDLQDVTPGSWGELMPPDQSWASKLANIWSGAIAVPEAALPVALAALGQAVVGRRKSFVFCLRPVAQSQAALGFCRWDRTTVINIDGLGQRWSADSDALESTVVELAAAVRASGVPTCMHWGKLGGGDAAGVQRDFGPEADPTSGLGQWRRARNLLLDTNEARNLFSSQSLRAAGLA